MPLLLTKKEADGGFGEFTQLVIKLTVAMPKLPTLSKDKVLHLDQNFNLTWA